MNSLIFFCGFIAAASAGNLLLTGGGVPLDTPEVASARAAHLAAHHEATVRNAALGAPAVYAAPAVYGAPAAVHAAPAVYAAPAPVIAAAPAGFPAAVAAPIAAPAVYAAPAVATYAIPEARTYAVPPAFGLPVVDTPEVAAVKVDHAAAHVEAKARNLAGYPYAAAGFLADTPDVAIAKGAHHSVKAATLVRDATVAAALAPVIGYAAPLTYAYGGHYGAHLLKIH